MLLIDNYFIDEDILTEQFACNLTACKGACCVEGDAGAPLTRQEIFILTDILPQVLPFLPPAGQKALEKQGAYIVAEGNNLETPLVDGKECAYTVFENGIALCGIEKAWKAGAVSFQKPISCHLYPIRDHFSRGFNYLNYDVWPICSPACTNGEKQKIRIYEFVKDAIIRKYGEPFYEQLKDMAKALDEEAGK